MTIKHSETAVIGVDGAEADRRSTKSLSLKLGIFCHECCRVDRRLLMQTLWKRTFP